MHEALQRLGRQQVESGYGPQRNRARERSCVCAAMQHCNTPTLSSTVNDTIEPDKKVKC